MTAAPPGKAVLPGTTTARPALWVDTNVMVEIFTFGDFFRDLSEGARTREIAERRGAPAADFFALAKRRRRLTRDSLWFAMALCLQNTTTISYRDEMVDNSLRMAPPGSRFALPTKALFNALIPHGLFDGWTIEMRSDGKALSTRGRDGLMSDICLAEGMDLVSRDGEACKRAARKGVHHFSPEEYAARVIAIEDARAMFLKRLDRAALSAAYAHVGFRLDEGWLPYYLRDAIQRYEGVWEWGWRGHETR